MTIAGIINEPNGESLAFAIGNKLALLFNLKQGGVDKNAFLVAGFEKNAIGVTRILFKLLGETGYFLDLNNDCSAHVNHISEVFNLKVSGNAFQFRTGDGVKTTTELIDAVETILSDVFDELLDDGQLKADNFVVKSTAGRGFWSNEKGWVPDSASATKFDQLTVRDSGFRRRLILSFAYALSAPSEDYHNENASNVDA